MEEEKEMSKQEQFELPDVKTVEDVDKNIDYVLSIYQSRSMAIIQLSEYLFEIGQLGKDWLAGKGITNKEQFEVYANRRQSKVREGTGKASRSARKQARADAFISNITNMAEQAEANMQRQIAEYDKNNLTESNKEIKMRNGKTISKIKISNVKVGDLVANTEEGKIDLPFIVSEIIKSDKDEFVTLKSEDGTVILKMKKDSEIDIYQTSKEVNIQSKMEQTELSPRANEVLARSLAEYEQADASKKAAFIKKVEDNLKLNERGESAIGVGLDADFVAAGREFLKQVAPKGDTEDELLHTAMVDVIKNHPNRKYGNLDMAEAKVLYSLDIQKLNADDDWYVEPQTQIGAVYKSLYDMGYIDLSDYVIDENRHLAHFHGNPNAVIYVLTDDAHDFINAVNARAETLKGITSGGDLFPADANIKPIESVKTYSDLKDCLLIEGDTEGTYIFEGKEIFAKEDGGKNEKWEIVDFFKYGMNLKHIPKNKLATKRKNKKLTFDEIVELYKDGAIEIGGIDTVITLNHCLKLLTKCIDFIDAKDAIVTEKSAQVFIGAQHDATKAEHEATKGKLKKAKAIIVKNAGEKSSELKEKAKQEEVATDLMFLHEDVLKKLGIYQKFNLYEKPELQAKYKELMDDGVAAMNLAPPLSDIILKDIEGSGAHALSQYLTLSGMFGDKSKEEHLEYLSRMKPERRKDYYLDADIYVPRTHYHADVYVPKVIEEKEEAPEKSEWKDAMDTLGMLIGLGGAKKQLAEWKDAIETLLMLHGENTEPAAFSEGGELKNTYFVLEYPEHKVTHKVKVYADTEEQAKAMISLSKGTPIDNIKLVDSGISEGARKEAVYSFKKGGEVIEKPEHGEKIAVTEKNINEFSPYKETVKKLSINDTLYVISENHLSPTDSNVSFATVTDWKPNKMAQDVIEHGEAYGWETLTREYKRQVAEKTDPTIFNRWSINQKLIPHAKKMADGGKILKDISTHKAVQEGEVINVYQKGLPVEIAEEGDMENYPHWFKDKFLFSLPFEQEEDLLPIFENYEENNRINREEANRDAKSMAKGGAVNARTREEIWKDLTIPQRVSFMNEHKSFINKEYKKNNKNTKLKLDDFATTIYSDLPSAVQQSLYLHADVKEFGKGGKVESIGFLESNLYLAGQGVDGNGNHVVKVHFPNQRAFSIQTNGVLPNTNRILKSIDDISELSDTDMSAIEKEVNEYVKEFGSAKQKKSLKIYDKFAEGGRVRRTKAQIAQAEYEAEVDKYKWYIVDTENKKAVSGFEEKSDAKDLINEGDYDPKIHKVVAKNALAKMGIENPNEHWKKLEHGGAISGGTSEEQAEILKDFPSKIVRSDIGLYKWKGGSKNVGQFFGFSSPYSQLFSIGDKYVAVLPSGGMPVWLIFPKKYWDYEGAVGVDHFIPDEIDLKKLDIYDLPKVLVDGDEVIEYQFKNGGKITREETIKSLEQKRDVFPENSAQWQKHNNAIVALKKVADAYGSEGDKIPNNYAGKTAEEVWNSWDKEQRKHFLLDHDYSDYTGAHLVKYKFIASPIQVKLSEHVSVGQYNKGGEVELPETPAKLQGYSVNIFKSAMGASPQNVVSKNVDRIVLVTDGIKGDSSFIMSNEPYLKLVKRMLFGKEHLSATPINFGVDKSSKMFGGSFVWSSDSRFREDVSEQPIPLHDRVEGARYEEGGDVGDYTKNMAKVEVFFENPKYNYVTNVNGDLTESQAREYFVGKNFNVESYPSEKTAKVKDITFHAKGTYADGGAITKDEYKKMRDDYDNFEWKFNDLEEIKDETERAAKKAELQKEADELEFKINRYERSGEYAKDKFTEIMDKWKMGVLKDPKHPKLVISYPSGFNDAVKVATAEAKLIDGSFTPSKSDNFFAEGGLLDEYSEIKETVRPEIEKAVSEGYDEVVTTTLGIGKETGVAVVKGNEVYKSYPLSYKSPITDVIQEIKSKFKGGGSISDNLEIYVGEISSMTGVKPVAIHNFISDNDLSNSEVLNITVGLGRKLISSSDFATAVSGEKGNEYIDKVITSANGAFKNISKADKGGSIWNDPIIFDSKEFFVDKHGVVDEVKDINETKKLKEVEVAGIKYRYNSVYKTYNSIEKNSILMGHDIVTAKDSDTEITY